MRFARERKVPFLGICFGMQMAVIEAARNLAGMRRRFLHRIRPLRRSPWSACSPNGRAATTSNAARAGGDLGGTMRLGAFPAALAEDSLVRAVYGDAAQISERHRHRYEVNIHYREQLEATGLRFSGLSPDGVLPEIVEYPDHPWFIGVQYHPELKSKPFAPHPLFEGFIAAAVAQSRLV